MLCERLHSWWLRFEAVLKRRQLDRDLAEELESHLAMREQKLIEQGMAPREARYAARRGFGNVVSLKETSREMWGFPALETLVQDMRYGMRMLRKSPGFTAVALLTLALGVGATSAVFSVVNCVLLKALPYDPSGQLVKIRQRTTKTFFGYWGPISLADALELRAQSHVFEQVVMAHWSIMSLTGDGHPEEVAVAEVSANFFPALAARPILGRAFSPEETEPGRERVVAISYGLWRQRFGAEKNVLGRTVSLNGTGYTVVGVMPADFSMMGFVEKLWTLGSDRQPVVP